MLKLLTENFQVVAKNIKMQEKKIYVYIFFTY